MMATVKSAIYRWLAPKGPEISVVFSPFKTGSTTTFDRLCKPRFCAGGHSNAFVAVPRDVIHFTLKCHSGDTHLGTLREKLGRPIRRIITLLRPQKEIYVSAYFQNISDAEYSYSFGTRDEVLNSDVNDLVDHFFSIRWESLRHLQIRENAREIEEYCGVNYFEALPLVEPSDFAILSGHAGTEETMIAVADVRILDDAKKFKMFWSSLKLPRLMNFQPIASMNSNTGRSKWYSEKYAEFRNAKSIHEYLSQSDDFITKN